MASNNGTAILTFDADAQAAQFSSEVVTTDALTGWTESALPATAVWTSVAFGGGVFAAVANNTAAYSTDGLSWTQTTIPTLLNHNIIYANGYFVGVPFGGATSVKSTDGGQTWVGSGLSANLSWGGLCFGNGVFVSVGYLSATAMSSTNGSAWSVRTLPVSAQWYATAYGNGTFVTTAQSSSISATSPDGINWTQHVLPATDVWEILIFARGLFLLIGSTGGTAYTSPDGINWTPFSTISRPFWHDCTAFVNDMYISLSLSSNPYATSSDGISWVERDFKIPPANWKGLAYGNGRIVTVGNNTSIAATSPDGIHSSSPVRTITTVNTEIVPAKPVVGSNVATVTITGQTGLLATDNIDAWIMGSDSTADHNAYEHKLKPFKPVITNVVAGVGFDIMGISDTRLDGDFKVRWAWAT